EGPERARAVGAPRRPLAEHERPRRHRRLGARLHDRLRHEEARLHLQGDRLHQLEGDQRALLEDPPALSVAGTSARIACERPPDAEAVFSSALLPSEHAPGAPPEASRSGRPCRSFAAAAVPLEGGMGMKRSKLFVMAGML